MRGVLDLLRCAWLSAGPGIPTLRAAPIVGGDVLLDASTSPGTGPNRSRPRGLLASVLVKSQEVV